MKQLNKQIPDDQHTDLFTGRVPDDLLKRAKHYALDHDMRLREVVIKSLEQLLTGKEK